MASVLNWRMDEVMLDSDKSGKIVETLVFVNGREIDFIIEDDRGVILCVEVKAGSAVSKDAFKHIVWFRKMLTGLKKRIKTGAWPMV